MATNFKLTYIAKSRRWRKRYNGKAYYFPLLDGETRDTSYHRCLMAWEKRKAELLNEARQPEILKLEKLHAAWGVFQNGMLRLMNSAKERGDEHDYLRWQDKVRSYKAKSEHVEQIIECLRNGEPIPERAPLEPTPDSPRVKPWEVEEQERQKSVGVLVDKYLEIRTQDAELGNLAEARVRVFRTALTLLKKHVGEGTPIDKFSGEVVQNYHTFLRKQVHEGKWQDSYVKTLWAVTRQFLGWCADVGVVEDVPRILKKLTIKTVTTSNEVFEIDEVKALLNGADERLRLYMLLMLNTGGTQQDISDFTPQQFDARKGVIIRKRSKTKGWERVPIVTYKLWKPTLKLLKKYRSSDSKHLLLHESGSPLRVEKVSRKVDYIYRDYRNLAKRVLGVEKPKPPKLFRKTSSSLIEEHDSTEVAQFFLGQAPTSIASKHYLQGPQSKLDVALVWLAEQYGIEG